SGFTHLGLVIIGLAVIVIGVAGWRVWEANHKDSTSSSELTMVQADGLEACRDEPLFDHIPMALEDFRAFRPLGFVSIPIHIFGAKNSNFAINLPDEHVSGLRVDFPGDAVVTSLVSTSSSSGDGYQITFYPCQEFKSYLTHLGTISDRLKAEFDKADKDCQDFVFDSSGTTTKCTAIMNLKVSSGEQAGTNDGFGGVDWGAVDFRISAEYVVPSHYDGDYPHYTSPVLYLRDDLKTKMLDKLGSWDGEVERTVEPRVGSLDQDIKGTAQGNWFVGDKNFYNSQDFSPFLALLHDYIDPTQPEFSMGTSVSGLTSGVYSFTVSSSGQNNRDFKDVKPDGKVYCYDTWLSGRSSGHVNLSTPTGVILLKVPDDLSLLVEHQTGSCDTVRSMTASATTFTR
ncbi:MAG: hypothetical protein AAB624_00085, partial [Patescibacteria group bacterium]